MAVILSQSQRYNHTDDTYRRCLSNLHFQEVRKQSERKIVNVYVVIIL